MRLKKLVARQLYLKWFFSGNIFLSELDDILTQCSPPIWCASRIVDTDLMTSLTTSSRNNRCRNFGAKYLENEAR